MNMPAKSLKRIISVIILLLSSFIYSCTKDTVDVSGRYLYEKCIDTSTEKDVTVRDIETALHIKNIKGKEYTIEYIGGSSSGTKMIGELDDDEIIVKLGKVKLIFSFSSDYKSISYTRENTKCIYNKL
jgi:hypothetical protein